MKLHKAKTKLGKRICGAIAWTSLIGVLSLPKPMEDDAIGLTAGIVMSAICIFGLAWGAWAAGAMNYEEVKNNG